jgi:nitrogen PTS system EIIA component
MLLSEILHPGVVKLTLDARDRFEAIDELVDCLIQAHDLPMSMRASVIEAVTAREHHSPTGMEHGVALPHAGLDSVHHAVGAIGVSNQRHRFRVDGR